MTDKQFKEAEKKIHSAGYGWTGGNYKKPEGEYAILEKELSAISMINSILAYNWSNQSAEQILKNEESHYHNYLEPHTKALGRNKILELIQNQINDIDHINRGCYTDGEGCSYNSIVWKN